MRILVVEDDRKVARFIQAGLEQEGHAVDVLHEGSGASEQASAIDYDVVVLDLMLPGRSGFQVLRDIRRRTAEMPVLILTGERVVVVGDRGWLERCLLNLLDNALKCTPQGGKVQVLVARKGDEAMVKVCDTGLGMSAGFAIAGR